MRLCISLTLWTFMLTAPMNVTHAQVPWYVGPTVNYGGNAASTPASAGGEAIADMIRAQGAYNAMSAAAMVSVEEARTKYIENQKLWTEVYLARQRAVQSQHESARKEARARIARYQDYLADPSHQPRRLDSSQLNPYTGHITWPIALERDVFLVQRLELEKIFAARAREMATSESTEELVVRLRELHDSLRDHIREIEAQEYMQARRFLDGLITEARFPSR